MPAALMSILPLLLSFLGPAALRKIAGTAAVGKVPMLQKILGSTPAGIGSSIGAYMLGEQLFNPESPPDDHMAVQASDQDVNMMALQAPQTLRLKDNELNLMELLNEQNETDRLLAHGMIF